jgi:hypothetical protein
MPAEGMPCNPPSVHFAVDQRLDALLVVISHIIDVRVHRLGSHFVGGIRVETRLNFGRMVSAWVKPSRNLTGRESPASGRAPARTIHWGSSDAWRSQVLHGAVHQSKHGASLYFAALNR